MEYQNIGNLSRVLHGRFGELSSKNLTQTHWCRVIDSLPHNQRRLLKRIYGLELKTEPITVKDLARRSGKSEDTVRVELTQALSALRRLLEG